MSSSRLAAAEGLEVELFHATGRSIGADERLVVVAMDSLVSGLIFATVSPPAGFQRARGCAHRQRVVEDWLRQRGGQLAPSSSSTQDHPRWELPENSPVQSAPDSEWFATSHRFAHCPKLRGRRQARRQEPSSPWHVASIAPRQSREQLGFLCGEFPWREMPRSTNAAQPLQL